VKTTFLTAALLLFFIFDLSAKVIYVEPVRNAKYVSVKNNVIIGFDEKIVSSDLNSLITVTGTLSGTHNGKIIVTSDGKKLIFQPEHPFVYNEQVEVKLNHLKTLFVSNNSLKYSFRTKVTKVDFDFKKFISEEPEYMANDNYVSPRQTGALPPLTVNISNNPSPGHLFLTNYLSSAYSANIIIANNDGTPYYSREMTDNTINFNRQPNGLFIYYRAVAQKYYAEDPQYNLVDSFYCGNGFTTDPHELRLLNNGHALLLGIDPEPVDMSVIVPGGDPNAIVMGLILQELDENKNVVFQWRSWDYFSIVDAIYLNLTAATIDYVHPNAIESDNDGNLIISSRHLSEITKINRSTGDIIWRMGGVHNEFTFVNDTIPFHYQHNIRRIANGNVTLFDNGNFRTPSFSRALEYHLDEVNKIATLVWQYINNPVIYGPSQGSVQRLRNGNTLICWGSTTPTMTEVTPAGNIALEMSLPQGQVSYRVFRDEVNLTLNVKLAIEGFYNTQSDKLNLKDTVTAYIRNNTSPYGIVDSAKAVIDSVNFNGNFLFYNVPSGSYYISTRHRNSLETWSKAGGESFTSGGVYLYDFTNSSSQAYGNNLVHKGSKYCIYSGDVNQDGFVDISDLGLVDNDITNFATGYLATDLNGDGFVELSDAAIADNNGFNFVGAVTP
jgi:Arylsulfotransferase (ASST)/Bacterial Ig-like domain/Dockerin type I domain